MSDTTYKLKVSSVELEHLRQFMDNESIANALAQLDAENNWREKLKDLLTDMRLWPIIASIVENREAHVFVSPNVRVKGKDLLGYKQDAIDNQHLGSGKKEFEPAVEINREVQLTKKGWEEALPLVQEALDAIQAKYATPYGCGLICKEGEYWKELSFVDDETAAEFRMFNADHQVHPAGRSCMLSFPATKKEKSPEEVWARVTKLPAKRKLVCVDGWSRCSRCGLPIRPAKTTSKTEVASA